MDSRDGELRQHNQSYTSVLPQLHYKSKQLTWKWWLIILKPLTCMKYLRFSQASYTHHRNIAHHSFIILIWKRFSTVMLKWVPSNWNMIQMWDLKTRLDMVKRHFTATEQGGGGTQTRQEQPCETGQRASRASEEWLIFWWPHVWLFQLPLEKPEGFLFCIIYMPILIFLWK